MDSSWYKRTALVLKASHKEQGNLGSIPAG